MELQPTQSRAEAESAPDAVNFFQNDDRDRQSYEEEGHWTLVDKGRKSPKAGKASQRPLPAGFEATPYPSDIKIKIWCGTRAVFVYAPPNTTSEEIAKASL